MGVNLFFLEQSDDLFSHRYESDDIFYLSSLHHSHLPVIYPVFFLNSTTKNCSSGVTPLEGVTRGGPPSDAIGMTFGDS